MEKLSGCLKSFNRKERFYVIGEITGNREFELSDEFRGKLQGVFNLSLPKEGIFTAIDYHIDWIIATQMICLKSTEYAEGIYPNMDGLITANQEDVDVLIAYSVGGIGHIIMLEAKGATGWANRQMNSKAKRLKNIFGEKGARWPNVIPHFGIMSPWKPKKLELNQWPRWMKRDGEVNWIELKMPDKLRKVTRCDKTGRITRDGSYWRAP